MKDGNDAYQGYDRKRSELEDYHWQSIGALFEGQHPTIRKGFLWGHSLEATIGVPKELRESHPEIEWEQRVPMAIESGNLSNDYTADTSNSDMARNSSTVCAVVRCIDDHPGAVASGHYVWPSSLSLCDYLVRNHGFSFASIGTAASPPSMDDNDGVLPPETMCDPFRRMPIRSVLELGSGSGILSIVASQVFRGTLEVLVVTDYDHTTLERARENYSSTLEVLHGMGRQQTIQTEFFPLEWGSQSDWQQIIDSLNSSETEELFEEKDRAPLTKNACFDMVLGSDLIDRAEVVEPLLSTVNTALRAKSNTGIHSSTEDGVFLLTQSFAYDAETEAEIKRVCNRFQLVRRVLHEKHLHSDNLARYYGGSQVISRQTYTKIQEFRRRID